MWPTHSPSHPIKLTLKPHLLSLAAASLLCAPASAQHLWWNLEGQRDATCLYGETTVLATAPAIYYCGANWHPGEPAGGYCGIQHNGTQERRTIFSIWDTSPQLHPKVTEADPDTVFGRFGGEGEGGHTHMLWPWNTNRPFSSSFASSPAAKPTPRTRAITFTTGARGNGDIAPPSPARTPANGASPRWVGASIHSLKTSPGGIARCPSWPSTGSGWGQAWTR